MRSCVCFDRMRVEHMQIGSYRCHKVALTNEGGIVLRILKYWIVVHCKDLEILQGS